MVNELAEKDTHFIPNWKVRNEDKKKLNPKKEIIFLNQDFHL